MKLTDKSIEIAYETLKIINRKKQSPTVTEIGKAVNLKSRPTVYTHLNRLRDHGLITWEQGETGTIQIIDPVFIVKEHEERVRRKKEDYIYG